MTASLSYHFIKNTHTMLTTYTIETYVDPYSGNTCEMFSVIIDGKKVYERDYGSCTEEVTEYIFNYKNHTK